MARKYDAKPPVKPIGRILYSDYMGDRNVWPHKEPTFDTVCDCKGFSSDRPFSVYKSKNEKDKKPFKVTFYWYNQDHKTKKVRRGGFDREETDYDTYSMLEILEEHETKSAAQKAMRRFAAATFAEVNDEPIGEGAVCHNRIGGYDDKKDRGRLEVKVGDLVTYSGIRDTLWRVAGEKRKDSAWYLKIEPAYVFMGKLDNAPKARLIRGHDCIHMIFPIDLVDLGTTYAHLGNLARDEAKRLAK